MNPRLVYLPYPSPYRIAGPSNCPTWPLYTPDLGLQMIYVQPYLQPPVVPCDPYMYTSTMPIVVQPTPPATLPTQGYQPYVGPPLIHDGHNRFPRPWLNRDIKPENNCSQYPNGVDNQLQKNVLSDGRIQESHKVVSTGSHRTNGSLKRNGRKKQKRAKTRKTKSPFGKLVAGSRPQSDDLSSIKTESTLAPLKVKIPGSEVGEDDADYETCEEDSAPPSKTSDDCHISNGADNDSAAKADQMVQGRVDLQSLFRDKQSSAEKKPKSSVVISPSRQSGKTFVLAGNCTPQGDRLVREVNEDYWAAISGTESLWNASDETLITSVCINPVNSCRCKDCALKQAKLTATPSQELWWDRSIGVDWWPTSRNIGEASFANFQGNERIGRQKSDEYIVIDANHVCDGSQHIQDSDINNNANSVSVPRRRLLTVDWDSISKSRDVSDSHNLINNQKECEDDRNIMDFDSAILERGPLATETFSLPAMLQASLNDTLQRMKSVPSLKTDNSIEKYTQKSSREKILRNGMNEFLQTAFTSNDACLVPDSKKEERSQNSAVSSAVDSYPIAKSGPNDIENSVSDDESKLTDLRRERHDEHTETSPSAMTTCHRSPAVQLTSASTQNPVTGGSLAVETKMPGRVERISKPENASSPRQNDIRKRHVEDRDAEIAPDSIEQAGPIEDQSKSKPVNEFNFPESDEMFRGRFIGGSYSSLPKSLKKSGTKAVAVEEPTENNHIYENSKPSPCLPERRDVQHRENKSAPSSPIRSVTKDSSKHSVSTSDLRDSLKLEQSLGTNNHENQPKSQKIVSKPPTGRQCLSGRINVAAKTVIEKVTHKTSASIEKPRSSWRAIAVDARYPAGLPLNSMLNDTIRRNFRQKSSPVAIFALNAHASETYSKHSKVTRPPSIDDWPTVLLQHVPVKNRHLQFSSGEVGVCAIPCGNESENTPGAAQGHCSSTQRFMPLPVVLCPSPDFFKPKFRGVGRHSRHKRQLLKRRRSFSTPHHSLSPRLRSAAFYKSRAMPLREMTHGSSNTKVAVNRTYPTSRGDISRPPEERTTVSETAAGENTTHLLDSMNDHGTKVDVGKTSIFQGEIGKCSKNELSNELDKDSFTGEGNQGVSSPLTDINEIYKKDRAGNEAAANLKDEISNGERKPKESFIKRFMKGKKWSKQSDRIHREGHGIHSSSNLHSLRTDELLNPKRKTSRQERIRANILEKKNRLLGREAKSRRKGLSSLEVGNNLAVSAQASTSSALVRGAPATDDRQNGTQFTAHTRRFTEEKNVKSALYKPTFLCMAAIETPGALSHRLEKQDNSSTSASEVISRIPEAESATERDSLTGTIKQGREEKSVVGTPGIRINSETGDVIETSDARLLTTFLSSTQILDHDNGAA